VPPDSKRAIYENVEAVATLYENAEHEMPAGQRGVDRVVELIGRPLFLAVYLALLAGWVIWNETTPSPLDEPPFFWLQGFVTATSLLTTIVILIAQRRQGVLAERRAHLDLQVNLLAESKIAKVIGLLEELRRDLPSVRNRVDREAEAMTEAADPEQVIRALTERGRHDR